MKAIHLLCSLPSLWDTFCIAVSNSAPNGTLVYNDISRALIIEETRHKTMGSLHHGKAHYVQKKIRQRRGCSRQHDSDKYAKDGKKDNALHAKSKSCSKREIQCHFCDKYGHIKKDCYAWQRQKGKGKAKDSDDEKEEKPKSFVKIQEINFVESHDAQDINVLTKFVETYYDAQDTLCMESTLSVEVLVSGQVSHGWILNLGASLHVTPHKEWLTCYEETIGSITLGDSYSCDIVGIGDIAMVLSNGYKFILENVCHCLV